MSETTQNVVINTETKKEYDELMQILEDKGFRWLRGALPTSAPSRWFGKDSCINLVDTTITYSPSGWYKENGYNIITFNEFKEKYMNNQPHNNPEYKAPEMKYRQGDILYSEIGYSRS